MKLKLMMILVLVLSCNVAGAWTVEEEPCGKYTNLFVGGPVNFKCERAKGHSGNCGNCEPCEKCMHKSPISMQEEIEMLKRRIDELESLSAYSYAIPPWNDNQDTLPFIMPEDWNITDSRSYKCAKCGNTYKTTTVSRTTSCCVIHPSGSCCHYMEELVDLDPDLQTTTEDTK